MQGLSLSVLEKIELNWIELVNKLSYVAFTRLSTIIYQFGV